jgi:hypothetical protein
LRESCLIGGPYGIHCHSRLSSRSRCRRLRYSYSGRIRSRAVDRFSPLNFTTGARCSPSPQRPGPDNLGIAYFSLGHVLRLRLPAPGYLPPAERGQAMHAGRRLLRLRRLVSLHRLVGAPTSAVRPASTSACGCGICSIPFCGSERLTLHDRSHQHGGKYGCNDAHGHSPFDVIWPLTAAWRPDCTKRDMNAA